MSNVATVGNKDISKIFETILSSPRMNEKCKIALTISRQNILALGRLIEAGFIDENSAFKDEIMAALAKESLDEFKTIHEEILKKGELTDFLPRIETTLTENQFPRSGKFSL